MVSKNREQLEDLVGDETQLAADRREAGLEVLLHRQQREDLAALRNIGDAAPGAGMRRQPGDVAVLPEDAAARDRLVPDDRAQQRGLADAVAAEHAGDAPGLGLEGDAAQRLRSAVVEIDAVDGEHPIAPGRLR